MTKRVLLTSGFVSLFAIAGCSSDASAPATSGGGTGGSAGSAVAGSNAAGSSGSLASAGTSGSGVSGGGTGGTSSGGSGGTGGASAGSGGSAGSSAGSAGSAGMSGGAGGGSATCAYKFCADFEGAAPGTATSDWKIDVDKKGSTVEAVTTKAHGGTHSVHVKISDMAGVFGYITETKSLAIGASFWGRVFIWSEVATPAGHIVNVAIDGKTGTTDEQVRIFNVINGKIAINRRSDDKGGVSNVAPTMGKWQCYEWHITPDTLDVYLDSTKLPISQTWANPTISLLRMGFERFTAGSAGELWLDDVAINDAQIGCN